MQSSAKSTEDDWESTRLELARYFLQTVAMVVYLCAGELPETENAATVEVCVHMYVCYRRCVCACTCVLSM
jgi:hypothetical protein